MENEVAILVGMRVSQLPNPYILSDKVRCSACGEEMWSSQVAQEDLAVYPTISFLCTWCYAKWVEDTGDEIPLELPGERTLASLESHGISRKLVYDLLEELMEEPWRAAE